MDLFNGPILSTLLRLSIPNSFAMLAAILVSLAETVYVGLLGTSALAGIAVVFPLLVLQQGLSVGAMGGGITSAISRALGAGDQERAEALALHGVAIGVVCGVSTTAVMLTCGPTIYRLLGATGDVLTKALEYSNVAFLGSPLIWLAFTLIAIVRATGNMRLASGVALFSLTLQAAVGAALGFGLGPLPALGMSGIALGLVVGLASAAAFLAFYLCSNRSTVRIRFSGFTFRRELFSEILQVGLLTCVSTIQTTLAVLIMTSFIARYGSEALAGYGIGARFEMILIPLSAGVGVACIPMVGMAIGAGNVARARRITLIGAILTASVVGALGLVLSIAPQIWANIFTDNPTTLQVAHTFLHWTGPAYAFFGMGICLLFASQGARKVLGPVLAGTARLITIFFGGLVLVYMEAPMHYYFALVAAAMIIYGTAAAFAVYLADWTPRNQHR
ncbi:MAG: MATE family efflux transporter [Xanthobacteraceae bacterium]|nr:MATE family efflux transporter [Xanthobacteraceae bacterium]QYK45638.1 MAG: MATE family efflux transporter [Xanthobacteraceae bacterium]